MRAVGNVLRQRFNKRGCTYLGVGPMSVNCVDAVIELSKEVASPLILIASRRQIDSLEFGGGYVNNWDTFAFARYVQERDPDRRVLLARDHGGPWQHPQELERCKNIGDAMESAKLSYLRDLEAGFQILHIDPVVNAGEATPSIEWVLDKVFELYSYCMDVARSMGREIIIELGTEEQQQSPIADPHALERVIDDVLVFCSEHAYAPPAFMVVQTGTKVVGRRNIGDFPSSYEDIQAYTTRHRLSEIVSLCERRNVMIKEHNADYLSSTSLKLHPQIGIHAVNVAPEFGVTETSALLDIMDRLSLRKLRDEFIEIAVNSRKWEKWVPPGEEVSDLEKAIICGHYVFSDERVVEIKLAVHACYSRTGGALEEELRLTVKKAILRYMRCFNP